jgi:hypothetical protein
MSGENNSRDEESLVMYDTPILVSTSAGKNKMGSSVTSLPSVKTQPA